MRKFWERVEAADHAAEQRVLEVLDARIESADERVSLSACQWWLERRRPAEWGKPKDEHGDDRVLTPEEQETEWRKLTGTEPPWKR